MSVSVCVVKHEEKKENRRVIAVLMIRKRHAQKVRIKANVQHQFEHIKPCDLDLGSFPSCTAFRQVLFGVPQTQCRDGRWILKSQIWIHVYILLDIFLGYSSGYNPCGSHFRTAASRAEQIGISWPDNLLWMASWPGILAKSPQMKPATHQLQFISCHNSL